MGSQCLTNGFSKALWLGLELLLFFFNRGNIIGNNAIKSYMLGYQKLTVYQRAIQWLIVSHKIVEALPRGNSILSSQLRRAALSIPLNVAEGAGKTHPADKKRFYGIARGSTYECAAILDVTEALNLIDGNTLKEGQHLLGEIAAMLSSLCLKWDQKEKETVQAQA